MDTSQRQSIRSVCVFCGSRTGHDSRYVESARQLAQGLVARGWELVYGGGRVGLMGELADATLAAGGRVIGVLPKPLATKELLHPQVTTMHIVETMHERKGLMAELSDAFVALPGGFGTYEETLEMITWGQLGIHRKVVGLLDVKGFYQPLLQLFDRAIEEGFIRAHQRQLLVTSEDPEELLERMSYHELPPVRQWISPAES
ncbi:MAG: TIGR00730 family Rossman fold protein [Planctomycetales bacterium]